MESRKAGPRYRTGISLAVVAAALSSVAACSEAPERSASEPSAPPAAPAASETVGPTPFVDDPVITRAMQHSHDGWNDRDANITDAVARIRSGTVEDSNTGHPCTSGKVVKIELRGSFPHVVVAPGPWSADSEVRTMLITSDASTGIPCLVGARAR